MTKQRNVVAAALSFQMQIGGGSFISGPWERFRVKPTSTTIFIDAILKGNAIESVKKKKSSCAKKWYENDEIIRMNYQPTIRNFLSRKETCHWLFKKVNLKHINYRLWINYSTNTKIE